MNSMIRECSERLEKCVEAPPGGVSYVMEFMTRFEPPTNNCLASA